MREAASIRSRICVKILNSGRSIFVVVVANFWNSKSESIPHIRQIIDHGFPFSEMNLTDRDFILLKIVGESVRISITYYHNNLNHFIFLGLITKSNITKIVSSSSAIVCRLKAKLLSKDTNPSNNTQLFIKEIQTNGCKSDNTWNVLLQRDVNAFGGHESDLMEEDRNNFVGFFWEIGVGRLPESNVFGTDCHTIDGTEVRKSIDFVDFFWEIGVGSLHELNVFGTDYHTIDVTEVREYIGFVDVPEKY
jgi:UDP-glucose 4-epimerase